VCVCLFSSNHIYFYHNLRCKDDEDGDGNEKVEAIVTEDDDW